MRARHRPSLSARPRHPEASSDAVVDNENARHLRAESPRVEASNDRTLHAALDRAAQHNESLALRCAALIDTVDRQSRLLDAAMLTKDAEIERLKAQNLELKKSISMSTRSSSVLTDEQIIDMMGILVFDLQNWVLQHFRRVKVRESHIWAAGTNYTVRDALQGSSASLSTHKVAILRKLAMCEMNTVFDDQLFCGLPDIERYGNLRQVFSDFQGNNPIFSNWRSATVTMLALSEDAAVGHSVDEQVGVVAKKIDSLLCDITGTLPGEDRFSKLRRITAKAVGLAHQLRGQKALFKIIMPHALSPKVLFYDPGFMIDVSGDEDTAHPGTRVAVVLSPYILKDADIVIVKAQVICATPTAA